MNSKAIPNRPHWIVTPAVGHMAPASIDLVLRSMLALERAGLGDVQAALIGRVVGPDADEDRLIDHLGHLRVFPRLLLLELEALAEATYSTNEKRDRALHTIALAGF